MSGRQPKYTLKGVARQALQKNADQQPPPLPTQVPAMLAAGAQGYEDVVRGKLV